jgi:hypothetical protein
MIILRIPEVRLNKLAWTVIAGSKSIYPKAVECSRSRIFINKVAALLKSSGSTYLRVQLPVVGFGYLTATV